MKPLTSPFRDTFITIVVAFALALFCKRFIVEGYRIPNASMNPSLLSGDRIFAAKWTFELLPDSGGALPVNRGDVVVFSYQPNLQAQTQGPEVDFVRRVVGVPGDRVEIQQGIVSLNGRSLVRVRPVSSVCPDEEIELLGGGSKRYPICTGELTLDSQGVEVVPAGSLFVVGDNRVEDSSDPKDNPRKVRRKEAQGASFRFLKGWGIVPLTSVKGRAVWRWTPSSGEDLSKTKSSFFLNHHLRLERMFRRIQ